MKLWKHLMKSNLFKRIITSIFLLLIIFVCLSLSKFLWLYLMIVTSIISYFEFSNLIKKIYKRKKNKKLQVNLAINYGSKIEIINAFKSIIKNKDSLNIKKFEKYLQTKNIPDPDLLIRTGNTKRLSNFLLWQLAYSEIFFEKKLWPAFNENDFNRIINKFKKTK